LAIQGAAGNNQLFDVASSTGASLFHIAPSGNVGIGTSTPTALMVLQGAAANPTLQFLEIASSTGASIFHVSANGTVGIGSSTPIASLAIQGRNGTVRSLVIASSTGQLLFEARQLSTAFGMAAISSAFVGKNSYFGEEFSQFRAANTLTIATAIRVGTTAVRGAGTSAVTTWGIGTLTANAYTNMASTSLCTFQSINRLNGVENITASSSLATQQMSCLETMSQASAATGSSTLLALYNSASLPVVQIKASTTPVQNFRMFLGAGDTTLASTTMPINGVGFTNCMDHPCTATSTNWIAMVSSNGTISTTSCPAIGTAKFAVMRFEIISTSRTDFYLDSDASNGVFETFCGTISAAPATTANLTPWINLVAVGSSRVGLDIDYYRSWQDDSDLPMAKTYALEEEEISSNVDLESSSAISQRYLAAGQVPLGVIVSLDTSGNIGMAKLANRGYDSKILGVVAPEGPVLFNDVSLEGPLVAIGGRARVNVSPMGGQIKKGDFITSSNSPGLGAKATRSGYVVGLALEDYDPEISTSSNPSILVAVKPGYQVINNLFVFGEEDGQLSGEVGLGVDAVSSSTAPSFLIDQVGSGNILQLQQNGVDRLILANDGSMTILASPVSPNSPVLTVKNQTEKVFEITAAGHLNVSKDTAGTAIIKAGDNQTTVTFAVPYENVPKVVITAQGLPDFFYGVATKTMESFTIQMNKQATADVAFDWMALAQPQETQSESSQDLSVTTSPSSPTGQIVSGSSGSGDGIIAGTSTPDSVVSSPTSAESGSLIDSSSPTSPTDTAPVPSGDDGAAGQAKTTDTVPTDIVPATPSIDAAPVSSADATPMVNP
jgi:hypothetical protein